MYIRKLFQHIEALNLKFKRAKDLTEAIFRARSIFAAFISPTNEELFEHAQRHGWIQETPEGLVVKVITPLRPHLDSDGTPSRDNTDLLFQEEKLILEALRGVQALLMSGRRSRELAQTIDSLKQAQNQLADHFENRVYKEP